MDIIKITAKNYISVESSRHIQYCGRTANSIGYGNPWEYRERALYARYRCKSKLEALKQYRLFIDELLNFHSQNKNILSINPDKRYYDRLVNLANRINDGTITGLAAYELDASNYQPVKDGDEQCHTEILYKACLRIIGSWT